MKLRHIASNLKYAFKAVVLGRPYPYLTSVVVTDKCNLDCDYCLSKNNGVVNASYDELSDYMKDAYSRGVRYIYFSGGEPTVWTDNGKNLKDLVKASFDIGFLDAFIATNGTNPLDIKECLYYISMDGPSYVHDKIKMNSFGRIIRNIEKSKSDRLFLTMTLTRENHIYLEEFAREAASIGRVKGMLLNFFTGDEKLNLRFGFTREEKNRIVERILRLKKDGAPFHVSNSALEAVRNNNWPRPMTALELYFNKKSYVCCRDVGNNEICANCGYVTCIEIAQIMRLRPDAILAMLKL